MNNKIVIIVNGQGGVGKDTLCGYFCRYYDGEMISAITPTLTIATNLGYKGGKSDADRKFLSDLQDILDGYFNTTRTYLEEELDRFSKNDKTVLFAVIRKSKDIAWYKQTAREYGIKSTTLVIRRESVEREDYGNDADDLVLEYPYDYAFFNNDPIEVAHPNFVTMIKLMTDEVI